MTGVQTCALPIFQGPNIARPANAPQPEPEEANGNVADPDDQPVTELADDVQPVQVAGQQRRQRQSRQQPKCHADCDQAGALAQHQLQHPAGCAAHQCG